MCNCSKPAVPQEVARARGVMCILCASGGLSATTCKRDGQAIAVHINGATPTCPKGRHCGIDGMVRWWGVRSRGVPHVLRAIIEVLVDSPHILMKSGKPLRLSGPLPGCGCVDTLKTAWESWTGQTEGESP